MNAYDCYCEYVDIKVHFSNLKYRYGKRKKPSVDAFEKRSDKAFFHRLSKLPNAKDVILANVVSNINDTWVGEITSGEAEKTYREWLSRIRSLKYTFKQDLTKLDNCYIKNFETDGNIPKIMRLYIQRKISLETLTILSWISNSIPYWDKKVIDPLYSVFSLKMKKYKLFLKYEEKDFFAIICEHFDINNPVIDNYDILKP